MCWSITSFLSCPHPWTVFLWKTQYRSDGSWPGTKPRHNQSLFLYPWNLSLVQITQNCNCLLTAIWTDHDFTSVSQRSTLNNVPKESSPQQINRNKRTSQSMESGSDLYFLLHLCSLSASSLTMRSKSTLRTSADDKSQRCLLTSEIPDHQWTRITIRHHPLTALKLQKPRGEKQQQNPRATVGLITQDLSRKWLNRKVPEVFRHPADTRRSQTKQTLPNPPQEHPNSWGRLKPQRNPLGKIHEVFPHNSITLGVNAAKAGSYLGSKYETDVSSHRPTPA